MSVEFGGKDFNVSLDFSLLYLFSGFTATILTVSLDENIN
jgi:hypothetical protein